MANETQAVSGYFTFTKMSIEDVTVIDVKACGDEMRPWQDALETFMQRLPELGD